MYIWLTHTTAILDLQAADNMGSSSLEAYKGLKCAQLRTDLQHLRRLAVLMRTLGSDRYHTHKVLPVPIEIF